MAKRNDNRKRDRFKNFMITFNLYPQHDPIYDDFFMNEIQKWVDAGHDINDYKGLAFFCSNLIITNITGNVNNNPTTANALVNAYFIIHDKDTYDDGTAKGVHIHMVLSFQKQLELPVVWHCSHLVNASSIEKPKAGRYAFDSMLGYLTHRTAPDKYQYDLAEVQDWSGNTDKYCDYAKKRATAWKERAGINAKKRQAVSLPSVLLDIAHGDLTWDNIFLTNELRDLYTLNPDKIEKAFDAHDKGLIFKAKHALEQHQFQKFAIFISGKTRAGKTQLAEALIANIRKACPSWRVYKPSSASPFDKYAGEEIAFLDDTKGQSQSEEDWLSTLDPNCGKEVHCRYSDRYLSARIIIITSTTNVYNYFAHARSHGAGEPLDQFIARFTWVLNVDSADKFYNDYCTKRNPHGLEYPLQNPFDDKDTSDEVKPELTILNKIADDNADWLTADCDNRRVVTVSVPEYFKTARSMSFKYGHGKNAYFEDRSTNYQLTATAGYDYIAPTDLNPDSMQVSPDLITEFLRLVDSKTYDDAVQLTPDEYLLQSLGIANRVAQ